jgi:hypothetical protein
VRDAIADHPALPVILEPLLIARAALRDQVAIIDKRVRKHSPPGPGPPGAC